jgi:hypothetical protein
MDPALWREAPPTHTQVAGIAVRHKVIADLALLLSQAGKSTLAVHVGQAWDRCWPDIPLDDRECADILSALQPVPPAELQPLYEALRDRIVATGKVASSTTHRPSRPDASSAVAPSPAASSSGS